MTRLLKNLSGIGKDSRVPYLVERYINKIRPHICGKLTVFLPSGAIVHISNGEDGLHSNIKIHNYKFFQEVFLDGWMGVVEAYLNGWWSSDDLLLFMDHMHQIDYEKFSERGSFYFLRRLIEYGIFIRKFNSLAQAKKNISYHYDLGNDFYRLWLDETMTYSSALFETGQESLEKAQIAKYASMIDEMGAQPGDHILEIGCGWGGFAEYAAKERGMRVTGLTISEEQFKYAVERIEKAGLSDRVNFKLQDYRDETGTYDGIASIEMFEAVGEKYWPVYFDTVRKRLKPGKNATLQIITVQDRRWDVYKRGVDFIQKYIFPGGMLPAPKVLRQQVEKAGFDIVRSVEFGKSYDLTLRRWHETFNDKWDQIAGMGFDERFRRMWNFYLTSCAATFASGNCDVTQITIQRPA